MGDLSFLKLEEQAYTPSEVWAVVDRIPNTASTHWKVFGEKVLPAILNLLLERYPVEAKEIAQAWAERSPKFDLSSFERRWRDLRRSPMTVPCMHTLQELAGDTSEASGDPLRGQWDALRQACAAVAGKLRKQWMEEQVRSRHSGEPLISAVSGAVLEPYECRAIYKPGKTLDDVVLAFARGMGRAPRDFNLKRGEGGGGRFADPSDVEQFTDCHNAVAQLAIASTDEAGAMRSADWASVHAELTRLQKELGAVTA